MRRRQTIQNKTRRPVRLRFRKSRRRNRTGLAALEIIMVIGAILPIVVLALFLLRAAMRNYHSLIGNVVGSPLF